MRVWENCFVFYCQVGINNITEQYRSDTRSANRVSVSLWYTKYWTLKVVQYP